jgi:hypothetical protein
VVRTGKGQNQELRDKILVNLNKQMTWKQTTREHRLKYTPDNGEDGRHLEGGGDNHKDR